MKAPAGTPEPGVPHVVYLPCRVGVCGTVTYVPIGEFKPALSESVIHYGDLIVVVHCFLFRAGWSVYLIPLQLTLDNLNKLYVEHQGGMRWDQIICKIM